MQPDTCMYLHLVESDSTAYDLVLSAQDEDWDEYWPAKYAMIEHKVKDDPHQQWYYSREDATLHNAADPSYTLDQDYGWLMVAKVHHDRHEVYEGFPHKTRHWYYDPVQQALRTNLYGVDSDVVISGQPKNWAWAEMAPHRQMIGSNAGKWRIEYCYGEPKVYNGQRAHADANEGDAYEEHEIVEEVWEEVVVPDPAHKVLNHTITTNVTNVTAPAAPTNATAPATPLLDPAANTTAPVADPAAATAPVAPITDPAAAANTTAPVADPAAGVAPANATAPL